MEIRKHFSLKNMIFARPFSTRVRFTNDVLLVFQIRWKLRIAVILLLDIRSQPQTDETHA